MTQMVGKYARLVLAVCLVCLSAQVGRADFSKASTVNPPTAIDEGDLQAVFSTKITPTLVSAFNFTTIPDTGLDGVVVSDVYQNPSTGMYAYKYQIQSFAAGDTLFVQGLGIDWANSPFEVSPSLGSTGGITGDHLFEITSDTSSLADPAFSFSSLQTLFTASGLDNLRLDLSYPNLDLGSGNMAIEKGENSASVVVFSNLRPIVKRVLNIRDTSPATVHPYVYVPSPEPGVIVSLLTGLPLALGWVAVRRRRRTK